MEGGSFCLAASYHVPCIIPHLILPIPSTSLTSVLFDLERLDALSLQEQLVCDVDQPPIV